LASPSTVEGLAGQPRPAAGAPRFAAFLGTKDEVDILPRTIENLRRIGVSSIIVFDRGSTDGTLDYLAAAEREGDIWVINRDLPDRDRPGRGIGSELAKSADADWIVFLDSDELWLPRSGSLQDLEDLDAADILSVRRYNVVLGPDGPLLPTGLTVPEYDHVVLHAEPIPDPQAHLGRHPEAPWIRGSLEPKVMVRPGAIAIMQPGQHDLDTAPGRWRRAIASDLIIAHVPFRSWELFERRAENVRRAIAADPGLFSSGMGWQWVRWARALDDGRAREEYERQVLDDQELARLRVSGVVRSAAEVLSRSMPVHASADEYLASVQRAEPWVTAAVRVCRLEDLTPVAMPRLLDSRQRPAVLIPPSWVVTFFGSWLGGWEVHERAIEALRILAQDPALPVPALVASGALDDEWRYIVTPFNPGVAYASVQDAVDPAGSSLLVRWLGRFVAQLHALPLEAADRESSLVRFRHVIDERRAGAANVLAERLGAAPALVEQLDEWLPSSEALMPSGPELVMALGDLSADHIFGEGTDAGFTPTSVITLSQAGPADPLFDLGPIWWSVLRGDRTLLADFLSEARLSGADDPGFPARALAWILLNPSRDDVHLSEAAGAATLDELAERLFGRPPDGATERGRATTLGSVKRSVGELACLGGPALFDEPLHVGRPNIGDRARLFGRLSEALDRRILTNDGPLVGELEERVAELLGVGHVVSVTNATIGLEIAAKAAGIEGQAIVPSFTFIATAHALDWVGIQPIFGDIEPRRLTLDPGAIEPLIGPRTTGIVATHVWGRTCDTEKLADLAASRGLRLLYDAAHALACSRDGRMVGTFGDAEVFSLHATKFVNAFEGGLITTNDDGIAERARLLRNFGFDGPDHTVSRGTNGKMSEASAAMALTSLESLDEFLTVNRRNERLYAQGLAGLDGVSLLEPDDRGVCNSQHVVVRIDPQACPLGRDHLRRVLRAENILARRYFYPGCHRMEPYVSRREGRPLTLPVTERVADEVLLLPTGTAVGSAEIAATCELIGFAIRNASVLIDRLAPLDGTPG
jgi:dTDP-4-amino-4,6-dideoxygalactose transaminase/aminoglycoside phosphotransferase